MLPPISIPIEINPTMLVLRLWPSARSSPEPAISGGSAAGSSLERNPGASVGWKKRDPDHCIGLGIVAALEKSPPAASQMVVLSAPIAISAHIGRRCPHDRDRRDTGGFFSVSPPACEDESPAGFRVADFLSHCNLCRKRLHGKNIYMYRGDKAFCSMECRHQQIVSDEYKEKRWSTGASAAAFPYAGDGRLFLIPSIAAA